MMRKAALLGLVVSAALAAILLRHRDGADPLLRTVPLQGQYLSMVVDEQDGRVLVSSGATTIKAPYGTLDVLDARSGSLVRHELVPLIGFGVHCCQIRLAVAAGAGRVFAGSIGDSRLLTLDGRSGAVVRTVPLHGLFKAVALDEQAGTVLAFDGGGVETFDLRTGVLVGYSPLPNGVDALQPVGAGVDAATGRAFFSGMGDTRAFVVDTHQGRSLRAAFAGSNALSLVVAPHSGRVFAFDYGIGGGGRTAMMLDSRTGTLLRRIGIGTTPIAAAVDERAGHVFVLCANSYLGRGTMSVLDARSGSLLRTIAAGSWPAAIAVDEHRGRAYVALGGADGAAGMPAGRGTVSVFDTRSGSLLATFPVGVDPQAIAIDGAAGRVFVLNGGGAVRDPDAWGWLPGALRAHLPFIPGGERRLILEPPSVSVIAAGQ